MRQEDLMHRRELQKSREKERVEAWLGCEMQMEEKGLGVNSALDNVGVAVR